jgi:asparagine synthase (glutamine-hydrolysing)
MCGIAGLVGRLDEANRSALRRMSDALAHRGPDGSGFWESPAAESGWGAMLAHRRLSILDLSNAASQPMVDPTTGDVVVLNGEIYNYVDLRRRMVAQGQEFQSTGDTAVMLRALCLEGAAAVETLRGMFAFGFWSARTGELTIARDPLGIKPLYVARNADPNGAWSMAFASEVRAILASGLIAHPRLSPLAPASVIWNGFMVAPSTAIEQIESVMPGELRSYDRRGKESLRRSYWTGCTDSATATGKATDEAELARELEESVRLHLASDVPLGVFLSGGVDSSAVANLAQKAAGSRVNTFTLSFEEAEYSEGSIARRVAEAIGTRHHELVLTEGHFVGRLESALDSLDQPSFDGLNSYFMSHAVREAGFKVALVGSGGDELFGGYASFRDLPKLMRWCRWSSWLPKRARVALGRAVAAALQPAQGGFAPQTRWAKLPDMIAHGEDPRALYQLAYALFVPETQRRLLRGHQHALVDGLPSGMRQRLDELDGGADDKGILARIARLEQTLFLGERLLRDTDAASMSASIEIRLPLVDQILAERVGRMPTAARFDPIGRKAALRRAGLRGLDAGLFERPKSGFVLPYDRWLRSGLGKAIDGTMRDRRAVESTGLDPVATAELWDAYQKGSPGLYWSRIWAIYAYVRWCHRHRVSL